MIACQVGNGTSCAIFSVLHGRYEIVPAVQYFPYCMAGTWVFASRGVPLKTRSPKGPQKVIRPTTFLSTFLNNFPAQCTCYASLIALLLVVHSPLPLLGQSGSHTQTVLFHPVSNQDVCEATLSIQSNRNHTMAHHRPPVELAYWLVG